MLVRCDDVLLDLVGHVGPESAVLAWERSERTDALAHAAHD